MILLGDNNKNKKIVRSPILFFLMNPFSFFWESFFGENCTGFPYLLFITELFMLHNPGKTTSGITSINLTLCGEAIDGILHYVQDNKIRCDYIFWWDMSFNNSFYIIFTWHINEVLLLNSFSFLFSQVFLLINSIFLLLSLESSSFFHLVSDFITVSCTFLVLWRLLTVN